MLKMAKFSITLIGLLCWMGGVLGQEVNKRIVCYYNSNGTNSVGPVLEEKDLKYALKYCTHLVWGYSSLDAANFSLKTPNESISMVKNLREQFPNLKIYLSVGGDKDPDAADSNKYINFLEGGKEVYENFVRSAIDTATTFGFDGLDLAFQFPRNKPRKVHSKIGLIWKCFKKLFTGNFIVDPKAQEHKEQFTTFVEQLHNRYSTENLSLLLTVLPNVNSSWYFDIPKIQSKFEFINLFAFDFLTPQRNPDEADYTASIYFKNRGNRLPHYNVDFQVQHWIHNGCPAQKLNLGIATYARVWKTTTDSGTTGEPVVPTTAGPADAGLQSKQPGLLSWPEVCEQTSVSKPGTESNGVEGEVSDIDLVYGSYFYRQAGNSENGVWMNFDNPDCVAFKVEYATLEELGGIALVDINHDDFNGVCTGTRFPLLNVVYDSLALNFCS